MDMMDKKLLYSYRNGNYDVKIYSDGTKIRETEEDEFIPAFAENCDVKITDRCDAHCPFCYEGSTINGKHAKLFNSTVTLDDNITSIKLEPAQEWLKHLHPGTELALNGNDLTHPDLNPVFPTLLWYLKQKKIITNITVNQKHFMKYHELLGKWTLRGLIHGIGISLSNCRDEEFFNVLNRFPNAVIHTIAGIHSVPELISCAGNKVLILGYKDLGRGSSYKEANLEKIDNRINAIKRSLPFLAECCKVLSFDNLALEQLDVKNILFKNKQDEWDTFYMGDDGTTTFYIDAVEETYSKNSCIPKDQRMSSIGLTIDEMFKNIQKL